jgi:hypothetical protein
MGSPLPPLACLVSTPDWSLALWSPPTPDFPVAWQGVARAHRDALVAVSLIWRQASHLAPLCQASYD